MTPTRWQQAISRDTAAGEIFLSSLTATWGTFLVLPFDSFDTSSAYVLMAQLAPEPLWGAYFAATGLAALWAQLRGTIGQRRTMAFILSWGWLFVAICFVYSSPRNTGGVTYSFIAAGAAWTYLRLSRVFG